MHSAIHFNIILDLIVQVVSNLKKYLKMRLSWLFSLAVSIFLLGYGVDSKNTGNFQNSFINYVVLY